MTVSGESSIVGSSGQLLRIIIRGGVIIGYFSGRRGTVLG